MCSYRLKNRRISSIMVSRRKSRLLKRASSALERWRSSVILMVAAQVGQIGLHALQLVLEGIVMNVGHGELPLSRWIAVDRC